MTRLIGIMVLAAYARSSLRMFSSSFVPSGCFMLKIISHHCIDEYSLDTSILMVYHITMKYKDFEKQAEEIGVGNRCIVSINGTEVASNNQLVLSFHPLLQR